MERIIAGCTVCPVRYNTANYWGCFILKGGRRRVIDNYEKQRSKTTDNQIHIITQGKNQCDTSEELIDVM